MTRPALDGIPPVLGCSLLVLVSQQVHTQVVLQRLVAAWEWQYSSLALDSGILNPPLSANSPTAVLSGLAIGGHVHIHNSIASFYVCLVCP